MNSLSCPHCNTPNEPSGFGHSSFTCHKCHSVVYIEWRAFVKGSVSAKSSASGLETAKQKKTAESKGRENYYADYELNDNPYPKNSLLFLAWAFGYMEERDNQPNIKEK